MAPFSFQEHTGEIKLHLEAASLAELLEVAAGGLAAVMEGGRETRASEVSGDQEVRQLVKIEAPDCNALLVDWLNELIFLSERDKQIFQDVRVTRASEQALEAVVGGVEMDDPQLPVKAATFHGLNVERGPKGYAVDVILDV
jgi:SHS2 domain-containing protein